MVNRFFRAKELAVALGISQRTVISAIHKGTIKADFLLNRYQIPFDECISFVRHCYARAWGDVSEAEQVERAKAILSNAKD